MSVVRIECPKMDTLPTSAWTPWLRITAKLPCDVFVDDVKQPYQIVFPPTPVRWSLWNGIWVDAGTATDVDADGNPFVDQQGIVHGNYITVEFPEEPVKRLDADTMRVLAVSATGRVAVLDGGGPASGWYEIRGMELPECFAHRDKNRPGVFVVDAVTLVGTI